MHINSPTCIQKPRTCIYQSTHHVYRGLYSCLNSPYLPNPQWWNLSEPEAIWHKTSIETRAICTQNKERFSTEKPFYIHAVKNIIVFKKNPFIQLPEEIASQFVQPWESCIYFAHNPFKHTPNILANSSPFNYTYHHGKSFVPPWRCLRCRHSC